MNAVTTYFNDKFIEKSIHSNEDISAVELKDLLLKSGAAAYGLQMNAHTSLEALSDCGAIVRKISSQLPSAGIALCMHQHVTLACARYPHIFHGTEKLLNEVKASDALIASAFAEGIPGMDIFAPSVTVVADGDKLTVNGSKKPCTLSSIADYFIISAGLQNAQQGQPKALTLLLIPHSHSTIQCRPFWHADVFRACDSNEVKFSDVKLSKDAMSAVSTEELQAILAYGMGTFNYFAANAYSGILDALFTKISPRVAQEPTVARVLMEYALKVNTLLGQLALLAHEADASQEAVPAIFSLRYLLEEQIESAAQFALRSCGGIGVFSSPDVLMLFSMVQLYKFHPASKFQFINSVLQTA